MRAFGIALITLTLILPTFSSAVSTCLERNSECSLGELIRIDKEADARALTREDHIAVLLDMITQLRRIILNFAATSQLYYCVEFNHDLRPGTTDEKTDGEVSTLQLFLSSANVYPEKLITGYYGPATSRAVHRWQVEQGIKDVDESTGVGTQTRNRIRLATCPALDG